MTLVKLTSIRGVDQLAGRSEYVEKNWFGEPGIYLCGLPSAVRQRQRVSGFVEPRPRPAVQRSGRREGVFEFCFSYSQDGALPASFQRLQSELAAYRAADSDGGERTVSEADAAQFTSC